MRCWPVFTLTVLLAAATGAVAETPAPSAPAVDKPHGHHGAHGARRHGNPADLDTYIERLEDARRDEWQKPDEVVQALALDKGHVACDVGAGPGYFTLRLARALGGGGHVYAVDVEERMTQELRDRLQRDGVRNVTPVLSLPDDPLLADGLCDLALIVDTYHHFGDGVAYLRRLRRALRPGGRVVNIDYHKRPTPVGPPLDHRLSREDFLADATRAGYALAREHGFLPYQYFLVLEPRN